MIKVGIVGSGFGVYGLLPAFGSLKKCEVVAVCGKKSDRLLKSCDFFGVKNIYSNWKEMLDNEKLDVLVIAVIPNIQYEISKYAIKKGINIFAEKPLTANLSQAKELFNLSKKNNVITAVDFTFPEIDEFIYIKKIIDKKEFGELKHISLSWNFFSYDLKNKISSWKTDIKEGGGAVSFFFCHSLYYLTYFAGEIKNIKSNILFSKKSLNGGEVGGDFLIDFSNNIKCNAHICCDSPGINEHKITFIFDKATVVLENNKDVMRGFDINIYKYKNGKNILLNKKLKKFELKDGEDERVFYVKRLANRFINNCIEKKENIPSFSDGLDVQKLISKIKN